MIYVVRLLEPYGEYQYWALDDICGANAARHTIESAVAEYRVLRFMLRKDGNDYTINHGVVYSHGKHHADVLLAGETIDDIIDHYPEHFI